MKLRLFSRESGTIKMTMYVCGAVAEDHRDHWCWAKDSGRWLYLSGSNGKWVISLRQFPWGTLVHSCWIQMGQHRSKEALFTGSQATERGGEGVKSLYPDFQIPALWHAGRISSSSHMCPTYSVSISPSGLRQATNT